MTPEARRNAIDDGLTLVAFALVVLVPLVVGVLRPPADISVAEKRKLASWPRPESWPDLADFASGVELYWDDHLGFRDSLIRANAWLRIRALGVSPLPRFIVGRDGWFFLGEPEPLDQFRGIARFDEAQLLRWQRVLEDRRDWLAERGIAYVIAVAPNKHSIYGEYMPRRYVRSNEESVYEQLRSHLRSHSDLAWVDLHEPLKAAKEGRRVYHRTDTHWNDSGAYLAYTELLEALAATVPSLAGAKPIRVRRRPRRVPGLGLVASFGLEGAFPEEELALPPVRPRARVAPEYRASYEKRVRAQQPFAFQVNDTDLPRAVMFRDSFANALVPYLSEHFERILYIWQPDVDPRIVDAEAPAVVIHEIGERFLRRAPRDIDQVVSRRTD